MIKTAEATGELEKTLDDMANYFTEVKNTSLLCQSFIRLFCCLEFRLQAAFLDPLYHFNRKNLLKALRESNYKQNKRINMGAIIVSVYFACIAILSILYFGYQDYRKSKK